MSVVGENAHQVVQDADEAPRRAGDAVQEQRRRPLGVHRLVPDLPVYS